MHDTAIFLLPFFNLLFLAAGVDYLSLSAALFITADGA